MLGLCRALLREPAEAEDAAQQTFLSAHRALLNGAAPREPAAWLATIARNECLARVRAGMRRPLPTADAERAAGAGDPVAEAIRRADLAALWRAIRALPPQQRDAVLLRELGGLRYDELAAALAVSEPAVESLLFRARARLRAQLKAAYTALAGAPWAESLARLLGGGGAQATAAKAVALGVGAAAVTGGAVVGPTMLQHRPHRTRAALVRQVRHQPAATTTPAVEPPPAPVAAPVVPVVPARPHRSRPARGREDGARETPAARSRTAGEDGGDGGGDATPAVATAPLPGAPVVPAATTPSVTTSDGSGDGSGRDGSRDGEGDH